MSTPRKQAARYAEPGQERTNLWGTDIDLVSKMSPSGAAGLEDIDNGSLLFAQMNKLLLANKSKFKKMSSCGWRYWQTWVSCLWCHSQNWKRSWYRRYSYAFNLGRGIFHILINGKGSSNQAESHWYPAWTNWSGYSTVSHRQPAAEFWNSMSAILSAF